jgi:threonine/homoserine/homoserine lactone efflux protein
VVAFLVALVPTIGVLFIFWIALRALLQADRRERAAQARIEAAERAGNHARSHHVADSAGGRREAPVDPDGT